MVRALRGATTVKNNTLDDILNGTGELLEKLLEANGIYSDDAISIIFTVTNDLDAAFPAAAARKLGLGDIPLMCMTEIPVPGSLEKCIRLLMHVNSEKSNKEMQHLYLKGARILRPDLAKISVAIDGPAGAGKSTIAKAVSKSLGFIYLDTGAMYRAVALKAINCSIDTSDPLKLAKLVENINLRIEFCSGEQQIFLDNEDVTGSIRTPEVSIGASNVAAIPAVRIKLVELQRKIAGQKSVVMDGRDIGTYVLPAADFKFFLTASIEERARRRHSEHLAKGVCNVCLEEVKKDIEYRDANDSGRAFAPLKKAADAIEIDSSEMTVSEVAEKILSIIRDRIGKA